MLKKFLLLFLILASGLAGAVDAPLQPEQAYRLAVRALDAKTLEATWKIAPGYYLYRQKFKFALAPGAGAAKLGAPKFPPGQVHDDEFFGKVETYRDEVRVLLPIEAAGATSVTLDTTAQGCADIGVCYPPLEQQATVSLLPAAQSPQFSPIAPPAASAPDRQGGDESSQISRMLKHASLWTLLLFFLGSGVALAFTPCMLPMLPILSGIIVGHGHDISKRRALVLSIAYVLGMAVSYALFGVAAGLSGTMLSSALQNVWVLAGFALVFVVLSLSMFGFYELQLPSFLQSRLSDQANRQQGGSLHGVVLMGALSAIIVGPCVAAPLAGALLYIARTGNAVLGGAALFVMALGMGLPLIVVATSARHLLPKPGPWMEAVKRFFGVLLLALAIWLVTPVIPAAAQMLAWALLLIFSAIYLSALDPLPAHAHGWSRFGKGLGVVLLLIGAALLIGALAGGRDPLQPLGFLRSRGAAAAETQAPQFERVKTTTELDARLAAADRPVLLDFYADWCVSCKEMERYTFADPAVAARMNKMLLLRADVTADDAADKALLRRFGLFGPPGIIFFDRGGHEVPDLRVVGFMKAAPFAAIVDRALAG
ncbi:thiol:disulfide interchange protein DsbD precursor [mine drainage metagenome]|uniref:Thiol:disulfide interchange protein DsbD n=1 Tax=mine drainage metagenome TaxID=410659 RepID=A0A1J5RKA0_9ZZZZ